MTILIIGLIVFFAVHFVPAIPGMKQSFKERLGANGYQGLFSLVAAVGFGLIIWGYSQAEWTTLYDPPVWGRHVTMAAVLAALICLVAFNLQGRIKQVLRHPMLTGIALWAIGHLFANGDVASVLLFGSFLVYSLLDIMLASAQGRVASVEVKPIHDVFAVAGGLIVYVVFIFLHPYVIGVPVI